MMMMMMKDRPLSHVARVHVQSVSKAFVGSEEDRRGRPPMQIFCSSPRSCTRRPERFPGLSAADDARSGF